MEKKTKLDYLDWDVIVNYMDAELRTEIHEQLAPCSKQEFLCLYEARHIEKYGEDFIIN